MEIARKSYCAVNSFVSSVIEWRSPAAAPYFMFINSAFWWGVFYLNKEIQLQLLVSLAATIFGWDILLSPTYERSILLHILTWPLRNLLRTVSVIMVLCSAQFLYRSELEKACWTAYTAVALLIINPVWQYHQAPQKINGCLYTIYVTTTYVIQKTVISPLCSFYRIFIYFVKLKWLTVLLGKIKKALLKITAVIRDTCDAAVMKLYTAKDAVLNIINSTLFKIKSIIFQTVCDLRNGLLAVKNGIVYAVVTVKNEIVYTVTNIWNGIISIIVVSKNGVLSVFLTCKRRIIDEILRLKNCFVRGIKGLKDDFYCAIVATRNYIYFTFVATRNSILNFCFTIMKWMKAKIVEPIRNTFCAVIRFLQYWLCAHWWPSLKSWFLLNVMTRLQMFFNYICFGIVYVTCGYWINPFIAFLSKHLVNFYDYLQRFIINPLERWIQCQFNKAVVCMRQMLHNLAIAVRDSILWPFFLLLLSLVNKICAYFYRIFLQPIIDILYERYKVCEDYLLIYFLGPVCQVFVDHIPERSPFCDDTDTELADLLPPGFNDGEESDTETSDKPSLPSRSLSPLTEDEHDFVCGLKFPNVDTSDSSEAEFALKPKSKPRIMMRKKEKVHPKDPAPSVCSDDLDSIVHESQGNKDKRSHSSSGSSYSESVISSSAQNAWNDADLQNFGEFNFELEDRLKSEFLGGVVEVRESNERPKERKQHASQKIGEIEGCDTRHAAASTDGLDGSFEVLDK